MTYKITPILCNEKHMANFAYLITPEGTNKTIIIDAAEARPIINELEKQNLIPQYILTTHHHFDHVEGNLPLQEKYKCPIIAPEKEFSQIPGATISVKDNETITLNDIKIKVIEAPGHTLGHILYYIENGNKLFTGDVLFNLCVGGLFEGTAEQMFHSLQRIKELPNNTEIFPGHEYTRSCIPHNFKITPESKEYLKKMYLREEGKLAPSTLLEEKLFNPYLKAETLKDFLQGE